LFDPVFFISSQITLVQSSEADFLHQTLFCPSNSEAIALILAVNVCKRALTQPDQLKEEFALQKLRVLIKEVVHEVIDTPSFFVYRHGSLPDKPI
jgi:hypothetical protein